MGRQVDLFGSRLGLHHFAFLRALAQGLPVLDAARRYLSVDRLAEARSCEASVGERVAAIARRRGDSRWRLVRIKLQQPSDKAGADAPPPLYEWAEQEGLGDWSEAELQDMYAERFGQVDQSARRRALRNERLRTKRLQLLRDLEAVAAERAKPTDLLDGWLATDLADQLRQGGDLTLADLQRRIARGGRWWSGLRAFGSTKAGRLAHHVEVLLGTPAEAAWPVATAEKSLAALSGAQGSNRALGVVAGTEARNDREAVRAWISAKAGSTHTAQQYEREAERFILWCVLERGKALSDATAEDCRAYLDFIAAVPDRWISRRSAARFAPGWAPFKGPLSLASQRVAIAALHSLFAWLVQARYLAGNPWVLVNRKLGDDPLRDEDDPSSRAFTPVAWTAMRAHLAAQTISPSVHRLTWLCAFVECTGLRAAEILRATRKDMAHVPAVKGWVLRVHGKGRRNRTVPVPAVALAATRAYFESRGLDFDTADPEIPLLASLVDGKPITYRSLHETFERFIRRVLPSLPAGERERTQRASAHWLRHTHATRAAEREVPLDVLQENLGQADPRTTARYYRAQIARRQAAMERAFDGAATSDDGE